MGKGLGVQRTWCHPETESSVVGWSVTPGEAGEASRVQVLGGALVTPGRGLALQLGRGDWEPREGLSRS